MFKKEIISLLSKEISLKPEQIEDLIEIPPNPEMGDYSFPCFILSKKEKKQPNQIAEKLSKKLKPTKTINQIKPIGPYLNFFINKEELAKQIIKINANFGKVNLGKKKKIAIDFSAPNIGKPMHIGHIRSTIIGDSMMRVYDFLGYNPIGINYLGDVGLHIGKLIVAYELWLNKENLKKDPVKELLNLYVKFNTKEAKDPELTEKAKEKLKQIELGEKKTEKIWNDIQKASGKGFDKVYKMLNINFHETIGQSNFSEKGKQIVINALEREIAKREPDQAVYVEIEGKKKYVLRSNQTAGYIAQDLGAAVERFKKYKFEKMIYITDFRQAQHFDSLFAILKAMEFDFADKLIHLPFGTVNFGKEIMATRKGKIILLQEVLDKTIEKAGNEIKKRKTKGDKTKVGTGAIKYIILKNEPARDVSFSWEQALSFEGNTGPYLQYSYARASSIIKKAEKQKSNKPSLKIPELNKSEISLIKKISLFPEIVERAGEKMNPSLIANYSYELAKTFSEFYTQCKVIGGDCEGFRLRLVDAFRTTLKNSLHLLGIDVMEEM
jgi:arginyl-tRNA synthetase